MHIWEKFDGIPGTPVVARQASYEEKRNFFFKVSIDDGYRLHFLVPGGHIGSPILHVKHHAR